MAWSIVDRWQSFSEALTKAWKAIKLQTKMRKGVVSFAFRKVDGSVRQAIGRLTDLPEVKGTGSASHSAMAYFDVEADGWRSFRVDLLM